MIKMKFIATAMLAGSLFVAAPASAEPHHGGHHRGEWHHEHDRDWDGLGWGLGLGLGLGLADEYDGYRACRERCYDDMEWPDACYDRCDRRWHRNGY